jgi:hypothetical protein
MLADTEVCTRVRISDLPFSTDLCFRTFWVLSSDLQVDDTVRAQMASVTH